MSEFERIARCFAPLADAAAARGLVDDVAVLVGAERWVLTTDAIVEGVHFLADDPIDRIARKALRVNLSDVAAKGAAGRFYLLTLVWPYSRDPAEMQGFASGLAVDQAMFGCTLIGGDTTGTPGPLTVSITLLAAPTEAGATPSRSGASAGDDVWVSGTIGDGVLGLEVRTRSHACGEGDAAFLMDRYQLPQPRTALAPTVAAFASASMDVSDGLLGDAAKLAASSNVALEIDPLAVPLSDAAQRWLGGQRDKDGALARLLVGGDDYEILFTAARSARDDIATSAAAAGIAVTRIGHVRTGRGVGAAGLPIASYEHRWKP